MARARNTGRKTTRVKTTRVRPRSISKNGKHGIDRLNGKGKSSQEVESSLTQLQKLTRERAQVIEELARLRAELQEAPDPTGDEVDSNVYEREKTLGLVEAYELRLQKIDNALRAAEKGEYGICQRCGKPIDPARLKIFPETRYCVTCQGELERQARRRLG
jgi:RNA polymerase-binding transcription factor